MKLFVYSWETVDATIVGHCMREDNAYYRLEVKDFRPFCFFDADYEVEDLDRYEYVNMYSSLDLLKKRSFIKATFPTKENIPWGGYMREVPSLSLFLSERDLPFTGWIQTDPALHAIDDVVQTYPKIVCFDIECISSSRQGMPQAWKREDNIEIISLVAKRYLSEESTKYLLYVGEESEVDVEDCECIRCASEEDLLQAFERTILREDPEVIMGYNIFGFDFDYILKRCRLRLQPLPDMSKEKGRTDSYPVQWTSSAYGQNFYNRVESSGRVFIDLMLFFQRMKLDSYSLDFVSKKYLGEGKDKISHEKFWRDRSLMNEYSRYCVKDSELTMRLFDMFYMWTEVCELSRIMMCDIQDLYTRGEQMKVLNQVIHHCVERKIVLVPNHRRNPWNNVIGAYVVEPTLGVSHNVVVLDFASMYPSILIANNICISTHLGNGEFSKRVQGILPGITHHLLSERKKIKTQLAGKSGIEYQILFARQNGLKVMANSMYGALGFKNNIYFGSSECANKITEIARQMLQNVISYVDEVEGMEVVYGDTDSVFVKLRSRDDTKFYEVCEEINKTLPNPMSLEYEELYDSVMFFSKKRYVMFKGADVKYKGVAVARRNYCAYTKECFEKIIRCISEKKSLEEIEVELCSMLLDLACGYVSQQQLTLTKSVKALETYKTTTSPQYIMASRRAQQNEEWESRLEYIFVKNDKKLQGEKMYTPDEVRDNDMEIDYLYYMQKQLLPVLGEVADLLGLGTSMKEHVRELTL